MKKIILKSFLLLAVLFLFLAPAISLAWTPGQPLVPCGNNVQPACTLADLFVLLANVYSFIVTYIATSLAVIVIIVGAIFILTSAGDPGRSGTGKKMIYGAIIGLVLVFGSWIIVDTFLKIIGYNGSWSTFP